MNRHVIALAVTPGLPIFELAVPCEVFGIDRSDIVKPWYDLRMCAGQPGPLHTSSGLVVNPDYDLADLVEADTVIVPACSTAVQDDPPPALLEALRVASQRGKRIVSLCGGVFLLAAAGLLDGRRAAAHWMGAPVLAHRYPAVTVDPSVLYVDDGDILTSAGTGAAIDLCLHLVRIDHGAWVANEVARRMVVAPHREGGQAQFAQPMDHKDGRTELGPVLDWARRHLDEPLTVTELAHRAQLSPRTFSRRFSEALGTAPKQWLTEQRVQLARNLLETTDEPIEGIARLSGFGTTANLRQHFLKITSVSPQSYRYVFRSGPNGHSRRGSAVPVRPRVSRWPGPR
jgi:transcriptional regulator GlxA family with amidase domain